MADATATVIPEGTTLVDMLAAATATFQKHIKNAEFAKFVAELARVHIASPADVMVAIAIMPKAKLERVAAWELPCRGAYVAVHHIVYFDMKFAGISTRGLQLPGAPQPNLQPFYLYDFDCLQRGIDHPWSMAGYEFDENHSRILDNFTIVFKQRGATLGVDPISITYAFKVKNEVAYLNTVRIKANKCEQTTYYIDGTVHKWSVCDGEYTRYYNAAGVNTITFDACMNVVYVTIGNTARWICPGAVVDTLWKRGEYIYRWQAANYDFECQSHVSALPASQRYVTV